MSKTPPDLPVTPAGNGADSSLGRSGLRLVAAQYGATIVNAGSLLLVLRFLTKTEFAVVAVLDILTSLTFFTDFGLNTVFHQLSPGQLRSPQTRDEGIRLIKLALVFRGIVLLLFTGLCWILAGSISRLFLKTGVYAPEVRLLAAGALAGALLESLLLLAQAAQDFRTVAIWTFWSGALRQTCGLVLFLWFGLWGYLAGLVAVIFGSALTLAWSLRQYWWNRVPLAPARATLRYGAPFTLRAFFRYGFIQLDQALVGALLNPAALASYSAAQRLAGYLNRATSSFQYPIMMRAVSLREEPAEVQGALFAKAMRYLPYLVVPLAVFMAAGSPWLMRVLGGSKYEGGWLILVALCAAQVGYALYGNMSMFVFALLPPKATLALDACVGIVNLAAAPVFILLLKQGGIALGQIAGFAAGFLYAGRLLRPIPALQLDWTGLRRLALPMALGALPVVAGQLLYGSLWSVPLYYLLGVGLFLLTLAPRLHPDDWELLRSLTPSRLGPVLHWLRRRFAPPLDPVKNVP